MIPIVYISVISSSISFTGRSMTEIRLGPFSMTDSKIISPKNTEISSSKAYPNTILAFSINFGFVRIASTCQHNEFAMPSFCQLTSREQNKTLIFHAFHGLSYSMYIIRSYSLPLPLKVNVTNIIRLFFDSFQYRWRIQQFWYLH